MKKEKILKFLKTNKISKFEKLSEPSAIAYETFLKKNKNFKISFSYFNRIYNLEQIK